jgi:hypothetical protein
MINPIAKRSIKLVGASVPNRAKFAEQVEQVFRGDVVAASIVSKGIPSIVLASSSDRIVPQVLHEQSSA